MVYLFPCLLPPLPAVPPGDSFAMAEGNTAQPIAGAASQESWMSQASSMERMFEIKISQALSTILSDADDRENRQARRCAEVNRDILSLQAQVSELQATIAKLMATDQVLRLGEDHPKTSTKSKNSKKSKDSEKSVVERRQVTHITEPVMETGAPSDASTSKSSTVNPTTATLPDLLPFDESDDTWQLVCDQ